jgi:hypothetical protein
MAKNTYSRIAVSGIPSLSLITGCLSLRKDQQRLFLTKEKIEFDQMTARSFGIELVVKGKFIIVGVTNMLGFDFRPESKHIAFYGITNLFEKFSDKVGGIQTFEIDKAEISKGIKINFLKKY